MAQVKNVEKKIWDVEGFDVTIKNNGKDLRGDKTGITQYPFVKADRNQATVADWKARRFQGTYPGFEVDVLDGAGNIVSAGQTQLGTIRDSYQDDE